MTVCRGEAYTATVTCGWSAINASVVVGVEFQQRHRALTGQPRHQSRPGGDHPQALGRRQCPGDHGGGYLAHRVSDDGVGFHTVGPPQRGQRQLHTDQHRLDPLDAGDRRPRRPARRASENPTCATKHGLQFGDRGGERRLIGEQLTAHPGPLRALTGIDEHRARSAQRPRAGRRPRPQAAPMATARKPATASA